jgi:hypothetical protein
MSDALPLPPRPNLDYYRSLARDLGKAVHRGAIHEWAARWITNLAQPANIVSIAEMLIAAGADVNATSEAYGKSTTLALAATSAHRRASASRVSNRRGREVHGIVRGQGHADVREGDADSTNGILLRCGEGSVAERSQLACGPSNARTVAGLGSRTEVCAT